MASKKYFTSWDEMIIGINKGCIEVFDLVCDALVEELNEVLIYWVYENKHEGEFYQRTFEMSDGLVKCKKSGMNAEFYFDEKPIVTIENPYHNILEEGGTMDELVDLATFGRLEDIRAYIVKRFPQLYRQYAKELL